MESTIVERGLFADEVHQQMIAYLDDQVPYLSVGLDTRKALMDYAESGGPLRFDSENDKTAYGDRILRMIQF